MSKELSLVHFSTMNPCRRKPTHLYIFLHICKRICVLFHRSVTCADPLQLKLLPEFTTPLERLENIVEKCVLRFPAIPFIPPEPYDVIETDYKTYALVQGAADTSFVQIYSRTPNPGKELIDTCLAKLKKLGYPVDRIRLTPQVLLVTSLINSKLWTFGFERRHKQKECALGFITFSCVIHNFFE